MPSMTLLSHMQEKIFVISLGGSIIMPDEIDEKFLKKFQQFILKKVSLGYKFIIITGGGRTCRKYQNVAERLNKATSDERDWIGVQSTKLNALLLKAVLRKVTHPVLIDERGKVKAFGKYSVIIGCGWSPGKTTDFNATGNAIDFGAKTVINLSNQDYVYTADPKKDKTATPILELFWKDYLKIIPKKRTPGMNVPFDPIASKLAQENNMKVIMANGRDLINLEKILINKPFKGTTIS